MQNPDGTVYMEEVFTINQTAYSTNAFTPQLTVEIVEVGSIRSQRMAEVWIYPVQFNPVTGQLQVYTDIEITLSFINPTSGVSVNTGIFSNICQNVMLNYTEGGIGASVNDRSQTPGTVSWVTVNNTSGQITADYLIIAAPAFFNSQNADLLALAQHRANYNGFDVAIVNVAHVVSDEVGYPYNEINVNYKYQKRLRNFIQSVYENGTANNTLDGKLGYVLLVGDDTVSVNANYEVKAHREWIEQYEPYEYTYLVDRNDHFYACVTPDENGYDMTPDLFIGRFSVDSEAKLHNIVSKTIHFETEYQFGDWKKNITLVAGAGSGYETYESAIDYVETLIPSSMSISKFKMSEMNSSTIQQAIVNRLNTGQLITHYDGHGSKISWSSDGLIFGPSQFGLLSNIHKQGFVFSSACLTGALNHTSDCMAEYFTSSENGSVVFHGATEKVPEFLGEQYSKTIHEVIWQNLTHIGGEIILQAYLNRRFSYFFVYFGDPALNLMAKGYRVTSDVTITGSHTIDREISVTNGATVTLANGSAINFTEDGGFNVLAGSSLAVGNNVTFTRQQASNVIRVSGNLLINGNIITQASILLESGGVLSFTNKTLRFAANSGVTVKPGGLLTANGGTLRYQSTNWLGITVEGNSSLPQTPANQAKVSLNGTTLRRATVGVNVRGGGILLVNNATFTDCHTAIQFEPYRYGGTYNISRVEGSTFTVTSYLANQSVRRLCFISLDGVASPTILGNTFTNLEPNSYSIPDRGYGLLVHNSDVNLYNPNTFQNLFTGINATVTTGVPSLDIWYQVISGCYNGIHVSGYPSPSVGMSSITVPSWVYPGYMPTGVSVVVQNSSILAGNTINGSGTGYGIHLNSPLGGSGFVIDNQLTSLNSGVVASGHTSYNNSIQVICNDFDGNTANDILITDKGIGSVQGSPSYSAHNSFLGSPRRNIYSTWQPITYYAYSQPYYPYKYNEQVKVMDSFDLAKCGDGFGIYKPLLEDITLQDDSLAQARQMLIALQDLGETEALVEIVEGEENPLALRNALLRRSPLLSDTVMVTASHDQVPLPNLMLAQVLMGNPQAAKSATVLQALDERENTLPDYLLEAIHEAGSGFSPIDGAKAEVARHRATRDILAGRLLARFTADSLGKPYDSIRMLPDHHPDRIYRYLSAFTHVEQGNLPEALIALQNMAGEPGLTPEQLQETEGVSQLMNVLAELEQAEIPLGYMDSLTRATLEGLATDGVGIAALLAGNALAVADTIPFLAQELAVGEAYSGTHAGEWSILLALEPFPVTDYVLAAYDLGGEPCRNPQIQVINGRGDVMYSEALTRSRFEVLVEVEGWRPGAYTVQLSDGGQVLAQRSFLILGHDEGAEAEEPETHELPDSAGITLHPNPTDGQLTVKVRGCGGECRFGYEVMTPSGVTLFTGSGSSSKVLTLAHLPKGTYLVAITLNGQRLVQPVVLR